MNENTKRLMYTLSLHELSHVDPHDKAEAVNKIFPEKEISIDKGYFSSPDKIRNLNQLFLDNCVIDVLAEDKKIMLNDVQKESLLNYLIAQDEIYDSTNKMILKTQKADFFERIGIQMSDGLKIVKKKGQVFDLAVNTYLNN